MLRRFLWTLWFLLGWLLDFHGNNLRSSILRWAFHHDGVLAPWANTYLSNKTFCPFQTKAAMFASDKEAHVLS